MTKIRTVPIYFPWSIIAIIACPYLLLAKINHTRLVTIYTPFAQIVFAAGAAISHSFIGFKVLMVILAVLFMELPETTIIFL